MDLERVMITRNGIGMGTSDGPVGSSGRINTAWFRLGYTQDDGIPGITPNSGPNQTDELGSADVNSTALEYGTNGILRTTKSGDDYTFKAFNPSIGSFPGNTLTSFVRVLGMWMPIGVSPTGKFGLITRTISARSGSQAGKGIVNVQEISDTGLIQNPPVIDPITTWNWAASSFQAGKYCWIEPNQQGFFFLVSCEC